jgi:hypothetical protein
MVARSFYSSLVCVNYFAELSNACAKSLHKSSTCSQPTDIRIKLSGTVSGSVQITLSSTTGFGTYINQSVLTTSTPTFAATTINGTLNVTVDNGYVLLTRSATNKYVGIDYRTSTTEKWFVGLRENLTSDNYIIYNANTNSDSLTLNITSNAATFIGAVTASNFSGTHSGASSNTNTGDETLTRINALSMVLLMLT